MTTKIHNLITRLTASIVLAAGLVFPFGLVNVAGAAHPIVDPIAIAARPTVEERMANHSYPRLALYYLEPIINTDDMPNFSKHDVLILDFEYQHDYPELFSRI